MKMNSSSAFCQAVAVTLAAFVCGSLTPVAQANDLTPIYDIQGSGHISPFLGQEVTTTGVVTALAFNGFYVQDVDGDDNDNTSDGLFVFVFGASISVGDHVQLTDTITEFIPGGAATGNLSTTQMSFPDTMVLESGVDLPDPVIIGRGGRIPPNVLVISPGETDPPINLQDPADDAANPFNPDEDGIDFYESLEGMLVTIEDPVAVSGTRTFSPFASEMFTLANDGADVAPDDARTARGGINLQPDPDNLGDQNPERVQIQFDGTLFPGSVPALTVGDLLDNVTGVVGYSFGNFEVNATEIFGSTSGGLTGERTRFRGSARKITVASYNVLNLSPDASDDNQRETLASQIVWNLRSPDIIALQEIQDNSGATDDGTVDATLTLQALVDAIAAAGGPGYSFFDVAPADGASGGVPGGNIRNAYLYNPSRVSLKEFFSLTPDVLADAGADNPNAFAGTRDPLLATFKFRGKKLTIINNHLTSRFGSTPIFGGVQPFLQAGEDEREGQVDALNAYVNSMLDDNEHSRIIVLGDLNTFEFTNDLREILPRGNRENKDDHHGKHNRILFNLIDRLKDDNVYTFNFEGNSQVLDHMLVTRNLKRNAKLDIVHVNVDFPRVDNTVGSDHEPIVVRIKLGGHGHGHGHDD